MISSRTAKRMLLSLGLGLQMIAQEAKPPAFDVASVKLAGEETVRVEGRRIQTAPNSLTTRGLSLRACILWAYGMPAQIIGPNWIDEVRLDIVAKTVKPASDAQLYLMLRTLLADRMGLKTHTEKKEMPVYALTLAKGGPKFSESTTEGPEVTRQDRTALIIERATLGELAAELSGKVFERPVIDATGLKGRYDIRLDMTPARASSQGDPSDRAGAMISMLQDQMGLTVVARKAPVDVLVIDHVERKPTEN